MDTMDHPFLRPSSYLRVSSYMTRILIIGIFCIYLSIIYKAQEQTMCNAFPLFFMEKPGNGFKAYPQVVFVVLKINKAVFG